MVSTFRHFGRALAFGVLALGLAGCVQTFTTEYAQPAPAEARTGWRAAKVEVVVPPELVVNDGNAYIPAGDIVWHGDPAGDRRAQVAAVLSAGVSAGVSGLHGPKPVIVTATLRRFHALTAKAYHAEIEDSGVHTVAFDLTVADAATGAVLAGPVTITADLPARLAPAGTPADAPLPGKLWKAEIEAHIAATVRGWLGIGPDVRGQFQRRGG